MGDKTIPDSAEPRLESFCPPFVADIDLPHQGVVDSYNLTLVSDLYFIISQCVEGQKKNKSESFGIQIPIYDFYI